MARKKRDTALKILTAQLDKLATNDSLEPPEEKEEEKTEYKPVKGRGRPKYNPKKDELIDTTKLLTI